MKIFPPFRLDPVNRCLWRGEARIELAPKVFAVLDHLVANPGRLISQSELLESLWPETYVQPEVLRKYILELRKTLGDRPKDPLFIETLPKRGYRFVAPVSDSVGQVPAAHPPAPPAPPAPPLATEDHADAKVPIGRSGSLADLESRLDLARRGQRQIVFVTGEAGIGKSTLIAAFQHRLDRENIHPALGQCMEGFAGKEAYYPVLEALGNSLNHGNQLSDAWIETLASRAPTWLIQFPSVLKTERREALQREILGATRERMLREICEALEAMSAHQTLVMILEDLHWGDPSTLDLISALARRRSPARLMLVATYRPVEVILSQSPLKTLKQDLLIHRLCHEVPLERLTEADVAEYLSESFQGSPFPDGLVSLIHRHSDGNPLFMSAIVTDLVKQKAVALNGGHWKLTAPLEALELGVPETMQQMMELQVDQLSEPEQRILRTASVAGQRFSAWAVGAMLGTGAAQAEETCERLAQRRQFIRPSRAQSPAQGALGASLSAQYEFRHSLYREALYRELAPAQRAALHRNLGEAAEKLIAAGDETGDFSLDLAGHFENGREYDRAARHLLKASENAARRYAHRDAIRSLEHALKLLAKAPQGASGSLEIEILEKLSDAHYALGEMEASAAADQKIAKLAGERGLRASQIDALTRIARAEAFRDPDMCVSVCEQAVAISHTHDDPLLRARTEMLAACWRIVSNGWRRSDADICAAAREKIRELTGADQPAYYEILYAHVESLQGNYAESLAIADAGLQRGIESQSLVVYLSALSSKALALMHLGWWGELQKTLQSGTDLAEKNGNHPWRGVFLSQLGWLHMQSFDFDGARKIAAEILREFTEEPPGQVRTIGLLTLGYADLTTGDPSSAQSYFLKVRDRESKPKFFLHWYWRMISEFGLVGSWLGMGELEKANTAADLFLKDVMATSDRALIAPAWDAKARVLASMGDLDQARRCAREAEQAIAGFDLPSVAWRVHSTARSLEAKAGNRELALQHRVRAEAALRTVAASFSESDPLRASLDAAAAHLFSQLEAELDPRAQTGRPGK